VFVALVLGKIRWIIKRCLAKKVEFLSCGTGCVMISLAVLAEH